MSKGVWVCMLGLVSRRLEHRLPLTEEAVICRRHYSVKLIEATMMNTLFREQPDEPPPGSCVMGPIFRNLPTKALWWLGVIEGQAARQADRRRAGCKLSDRRCASTAGEP